MKNKGFTLIELLAVIVILAIIALIATPIILNIIENTRESSTERSVDMYAKAVNNAVAKYQLNNNTKTIEGSYTPSADGKTLTNIADENETLIIEYDGDPVLCTTIQIYKNGKMYLAGCSVNGTAVEGYTYGEQQSSGSSTDTATSNCTVTRQNEGVYTLGDTVTCGTRNTAQEFYVMSSDDTAVTMFTKYPLDPTTSPYLQNQNASTLGFSSSEYWLSSTNPRTLSNTYSISSDIGVAYVYDSNSNWYTPIEGYQEYLQTTLGLTTADAKPISYEQTLDIGCVYDAMYGYDGYDPTPADLSNSSYTCANAPEWYRNSSTSLGSVYPSYQESSYGYVLLVKQGDGLFIEDGTYRYTVSVQPTVTVSASELEN